jgi:hypothetical protein
MYKEVNWKLYVEVVTRDFVNKRVNIMLTSSFNWAAVVRKNICGCSLFGLQYEQGNKES